MAMNKRDSSKTREQLLAELATTRARMSGLEAEVSTLPASRDTTEITTAPGQKQSDAWFRNLIANIPDLVWLKNLDGVYLACNATFEKFFGLQAADVIGKTDHDVFSKELAEFFRAYDCKALEADGPSRNEEWLMSAHGNYQGLFETIKTPMRDAYGRIFGVLGIARDITERKAQELEVQRWMERFEILSRVAHHLFCEHDLHTDAVTWSGACREMLGIDKEELSGPSERWLALLHPDDQPGLLRVLDNARSSCGNFTAEYRVRHRDGHYVYLHESGVFLPGGDEQAAKRISVIQDISARTIAEQALLESEERFRNIVEQYPYSTMIFGPSGETVYVNDASLRLWGVTNEQAMQYNLFMDQQLKDLQVLPYFLRAYSGEQISVPPVEYNPEATIGVGNRKIVQSELYPIRNAQGVVTLVVSVNQDLTERMRAERAMAASEKKYRSLFESALDSILMYDGDRIVDCNPSAMRLFGLSREELLGKTATTLSPELQPSGQTSKHGVEKLMQEARMVFDWVHLRSDGTEVPVEIALTPLELGGKQLMMTMLRDVTERKRSEQMLRQSEEKFSTVFNLAPYSIFIVRVSDNVILEANQASETTTGFTRDELVGNKALDLKMWAEPHQREKLLEQLHRDKIVLDYDFTMRRKDGELRDTLLSVQLIAISGEECFLNILRDITDTKLAQQTLVQTEKMMSLGGLAAGMAHEINNPLSGILQGAQVIINRLTADTPLNREAAQASGCTLEALHAYMTQRDILTMMQSIRESAKRGAHIVANMLEFSRRSDTGMELVSIVDVLDKALELASNDYNLKKKYDFRRMSIVRDYAPGLPMVRCARTEIEQVILNLLTNSAHAIGSAIRDESAPMISLRVRQEGGEIVIQVADNGPGMDESVRKRIFDSFFTTKPSGIGTGLGLSVSKFIIADNHKGNIDVQTVLGQGTTFTIRLPL